MQLPLLVFQTLLGVGIFTSYVTVLGNVGNGFQLQGVTSFAYLESPYWLGMPRDTIVGLVVMQCIAAVGYLVWFFWLINAEVTQGLLRHNWMRVLQIAVFLMSSLAWPYTAYLVLSRPHSVMRALVSCGCLWIAASSVIVMIGTTFEARAPVAPTLGILLLGNVVVLADGVGWSALCLYNALYVNAPPNQLSSLTARVA